MLEKKIYTEWAYSENESEKAKINDEIFKELQKKYKYSTNGYSLSQDEKEKMDLIFNVDYCFGCNKYTIVKNKTNLSLNELALICDSGNLCFGYYTRGSQICINTD